MSLGRSCEGALVLSGEDVDGPALEVAIPGRAWQPLEPQGARRRVRGYEADGRRGALEALGAPLRREVGGQRPRAVCVAVLGGTVGAPRLFSQQLRAYIEMLHSL